eukprot:GHVS01077423.1.p1 GENE.GHVS01077423.1~~GHVS01077423.1.p1  ORF type:complete len:284 (-),score=37.78 GHVS01077423.1:505-1356(-)
MYAPQSSPPSVAPPMYTAYYGPSTSQHTYGPASQQHYGTSAGQLAGCPSQFPYSHPTATSSVPNTAYAVGEDNRGYQMRPGGTPMLFPPTLDGPYDVVSPSSAGGDVVMECLGGGAPGVPFDVPNFRSLVGGIIAGLMAMICISLFICVGRCDFNFVFYLVGYYIWCIESDVTSYEGVHKLVRTVHQYTMALCLACLIDVTWLFMGFSTWLCAGGTADSCFDAPEDIKLRWTYGLHSTVLFLSTVNLFIKAAVIIMSFAWTQKQRKGSAPTSPSALYPPSIPS